MALGRNGDRVAKTPIRRLPPSLGGRTVGVQPFPMHWENCQISHRWLNPSSPRSASGLRYSGSNTTRAVRLSTSPLWRGMPNLEPKSLRTRALYGEGYESPPKWQGGRYSATMVKENNQWHIRSLSLLELLDTGNEDVQP